MLNYQSVYPISRLVVSLGLAPSRAERWNAVHAFRATGGPEQRVIGMEEPHGYGSIAMKIPFLVGWTSINPSYFDVNYRGTGFWHTATWFPVDFPWNQSNDDVHEDVHDSLLMWFHCLDLFGLIYKKMGTFLGWDLLPLEPWMVRYYKGANYDSAASCLKMESSDDPVLNILWPSCPRVKRATRRKSAAARGKESARYHGDGAMACCRCFIGDLQSCQAVGYISKVGG
jgi:hypothetical protein